MSLKNITIRTPLIYEQRVFHTTRGLTIYIKTYLKAKAELWKIKYLSMQKYNNLQKKNPLKETKILQKYYNSIITNPKFQHKPKYHFSKLLI